MLRISAENAQGPVSMNELVTLPQMDETQIQTITFSSNPEADSFVFAVTVLTLRPEVITRKQTFLLGSWKMALASKLPPDRMTHKNNLQAIALQPVHIKSKSQTLSLSCVF